MSYYNRGDNRRGSHHHSSSKSKCNTLENVFGESKCCFSIGSYGSSNRASNGNSLLDDLDSFVVEPLRPGPPVIKNFYSESPLIVNRPQVTADDIEFSIVQLVCFG